MMAETTVDVNGMTAKGDLDPKPKHPVSKLLLILVLSPKVENTLTIVSLLIPGPKSLNCTDNSSSNVLSLIVI
jgi:hypothetical protein